MNFLHQRLFNEADDMGDLGGGGNVDDLELPDNLFDGDGEPVGGPHQVDDGTIPEPKPVAAAAFDADKLAAAIARGIAPALAPRQQAASPAIDEKEFRKLTKYYEVSKEDVIELYGNPPEGTTDPEKWIAARAGVMQRQLDGMATHAMTVNQQMTQYMVKQALAPYETLLAANRDSVTKQFAEQIVGFVPALKGMEPIINQSIAMMKAQGYVPKGDKEDMKAVVATAMTLIRVANPNFSLKTGVNGGGIPARGNLPGAVNGAGGGGTGNRTKQTGNAIKALFDD